MLIDTHCHIHEKDYPLPIDEVVARAQEYSVSKMICVGTTAESSLRAIKATQAYDNIYAAAGVHPHDASGGVDEVLEIIATNADSLVAVGEIGLDYFYLHSAKEQQIQTLEKQLEAALKADIPVTFHVRDAFSDFWPIFDNFTGVRGVLHSFTDSIENMERGLSRGLYIGVNGISTFTKDSEQKKMFAAVPLERLLLETDAPFLTPSPYRGKVNEPSRVREVAKYHAAIRELPLEVLANRTTRNAEALFGI